jgi:hypothetical protein
MPITSIVTLSEDGARKIARRAADMRGNRRYLDPDAGRPDLGILRARQLGRDRRSRLCAGSRQVVSARIRASSDGQVRGGG